MKFAITALAILGIAFTALGASKPTERARLEDRTAYLNKMETRVNSVETTLVKMKAERDSLAQDSVPHKQLSNRIDKIQKKVDDVRNDLRQVRNNPAKGTTDKENDIDRDVAELEILIATRAD